MARQFSFVRISAYPTAIPWRRDLFRSCASRKVFGTHLPRMATSQIYQVTAFCAARIKASDLLVLAAVGADDVFLSLVFIESFGDHNQVVFPTPVVRLTHATYFEGLTARAVPGSSPTWEIGTERRTKVGPIPNEPSV